MEAKISESTRRELLALAQKRYVNSPWREKVRFLTSLLLEQNMTDN
jgi:hypothetical protein